MIGREAEAVNDKTLTFFEEAGLAGFHTLSGVCADPRVTPVDSRAP